MLDGTAPPTDFGSVAELRRVSKASALETLLKHRCFAEGGAVVQAPFPNQSVVAKVVCLSRAIECENNRTHFAVPGAFGDGYPFDPRPWVVAVTSARRTSGDSFASSVILMPEATTWWSFF